MVLRHTHPTEPLARASRRAAFTLMEVLVVVAILVVLAGVGIPIYQRIQEGAYKNTTKTIIAKIEQAIEAYKQDHDQQLPPSLEALTQNDGLSTTTYLETKSLKDAWNQDIHWDPNTRHPQSGRIKIMSPGPPGSNQPVTNW
jgi:prepilin-type N-terminal cleavage/methylation domain-containing protein